MKNCILLFAIITLFSACKTSKQVLETKTEARVEEVEENIENQIEDETISDLYKESHRPQFHFSPKEKWMNDPNGMVFYDGEYHLFYQYHPDSNVWGPMHWGHAVSTDLVHWEHLPIALYPDEHGLIFSGSAVIDWNNTSGFGINDQPPMIAIFSYHDMEKERIGDSDFQTQGIAYSNDKGRTWEKYENNPVIANPGVRDFRDPKVFWHSESEQWVMAVSALDHLMFYGSENLKDWKLLSEFGKDIGSHDGVWECPDLFPLPYEGGEKWVILQNMNPGNPNGGSGLQYFVGHFDGKEFKVDEKFDELLKIIPTHAPKGEVFEDFENNYEKWTVEGTAFGEVPAKGMLVEEQEVSGYEGEGLANTFLNGDGTTGTLTSNTFTITKDAINFLIGGGSHRGRTYIALEVNGKQIRVAEGKNVEKLTWRGWDVANFKGQEARIKIVDKHTDDWGHINIDQITFADEVAYGEKTGSVWLDAGADNYAGVTWSDVPESDGRRIFIGWMSNWFYAQQVPTEVWRSAMTIPWYLALVNVNGIPRLISKPVKELQKLRTSSQLIDGKSIELPASSLAELEMEVKADDFSFSLKNGLNEMIIT